MGFIRKIEKYSDLLKIISNYGTRLWSLFSVFIFIPYYIKFLGIESYGIIGFYSLLLGILSFADSGLSSAITREFASSNNDHYKYSIFKLLEKKYQLICLFLVIILILLAPFVANKWLKAESIEINSLIYYIRLIGIGVCLQLISTFYFGALFGLHKQIQANLVQFIWSIFKSAIVLLLFYWYEATLEVFLVWQILCNLIYVLFLRYLVVVNIVVLEGGKMLSSIPKATIHYIGGMSLVAIISSINVQSDKILISSFFTLREYGYYSIASVLSQLPLIMATPLTMTVFPVFSKFAYNLDFKDKLINVFKKSTFLTTLIVLCVTMTLLFYTKELLYMWTKNSIPSQYISTILIVIRLLTVGTTFLALQLILYNVLLAFGKTKYTIYQGFFQIAIGIPLLYISIKSIGMIGATIPWVLINLGSFIYLFYICNTYFLAINKMNYFLHLLIIPSAIIFGVFGILYFIYLSSGISFIPFLLISGLVSIFVNILFYNKFGKRPLLSIKHLVNFDE